MRFPSGDQLPLTALFVIRTRPLPFGLIAYSEPEPYAYGVVSLYSTRPLRPDPLVAPAVVTLTSTAAASTTTASIACLMVAPSFDAVVAIFATRPCGSRDPPVRGREPAVRI